jgi:hypothetical protein
MAAGLKPRRHGADGEPVVGQRAAIVEQAVDAGAHAARIADVEGAVEDQIARDVDPVAAGVVEEVGQPELVIQK